jgi:hypothetical protein
VRSAKGQLSLDCVASSLLRVTASDQVTEGDGDGGLSVRHRPCAQGATVDARREVADRHEVSRESVNKCTFHQYCQVERAGLVTTKTDKEPKRGSDMDREGYWYTRSPEHLRQRRLPASLAQSLTAMRVCSVLA